MDAEQFDSLSRAFSTRRTRRAATALLGGVAGASILNEFDTDAKKKKKKKKKNNRGCTPNCGNSCGGGDGCGGTCGCVSGAICDGGTCQPCTVNHNGNDVQSGAALNAALISGGTIRVCPGRYVGYFAVKPGRVIGAGDGANLASNTILDSRGAGTKPAGVYSVVRIEEGATTLTRLRITGDQTAGVLVANMGDATIDGCTVTENLGQGVRARSKLQLRNSTVSDNTYSASPGCGVYIDTSAACSIENCRITGNRLSGENGAGVWVFNSAVTIVGTEISGNRAEGAQGGGLGVGSGQVAFDSTSRVTGNFAGVSGGGGIFRSGGTVTLNGATVSGNSPTNCVGVPDCTG